MQEGAVMEIVKSFIGIMLIMLLLSVTIFFMHVGQVNNFKQVVNYQIERNGGLTATAINEIEDYSNTYFDGRFTVSSDKLNQKVEYGEMVDYQITALFDIVIFPIPDVAMSFSGTGISQIR
jgi:hypothetical protein